jgi:hypothetical protein
VSAVVVAVGDRCAAGDAPGRSAGADRRAGCAPGRSLARELPETMRHGAHRALRQVLAAAVHWQWIDRNVAADVPNPLHARTEFETFGSWEEVDALARELGPFGPLAVFCVGTGV